MGISMNISFKERFQIRREAEKFIKNQQYEKAIHCFKEAYLKFPQHHWYALWIGDLCRYYLKDSESALRWYEPPLTGEHRLKDTSALSPTRYLLKRVSNMYFDLQNWEKTCHYFDWFIGFQPSNFHDKEFVRYAYALDQMGKQSKALEILQLGMQHSSSIDIKECWNKLSQEKIEIKPFPKVRHGYERIPVKTDIIMPGANIAAVVDEYTRDLRKPGDILTMASCVVAVAERRMYSADSIKASLLAKLLSRAVHDDQFPFGGNAPLCNPLSMQAAINESGWWRILMAAAFGGVISKLIKGSGMFYRLAGEQAALIDDMPGAIPPFDYYVVMGPRNATATCRAIKDCTGHESAIIDANDLQIAWAVGCSNPSLKSTIEETMKDNPAGNGDQRTPLIILRPLQ